MPTSPVARVIQTLATAIQAGRLAPGTQLPTHRQLADQHGMAIASASKVYARLAAMGLVIGETGRGTFVRERPAQRQWDRADEARRDRTSVDLSFNHPTWPGQADLLRSMLRELANSGDLTALMHQQPPGGRPHERRIVADFLATGRGIPATEDQILLVNGAQQGLDVTVRALLRPHDAVAVDGLTYPGFRMLAEVQNLALHPFPGSADGPDLDALDALCRRTAIRAIYCMPTLHNPHGWVLDRGQRHRLVEIARRHDCLLIEDAAYAHLVANAPPPLITLAPERTVYVSSLSKSLASGLRFGFIVAPEAHAGPIKAAIRASCWSLPSVVTAMATRWIASGVVREQERRLRADARRRQAIAGEVLSGLTFHAHPAAMFLWLQLPADLRADRITSALAQQGITVSKAEAYATGRQVPHALRLGLGSVPITELAAVLRRTREIIERFPL